MKHYFSALCASILLFSGCKSATSENSALSHPPEAAALVSTPSDSLQVQSHALADSLLSKAIRLKEAAAFDSAIVYAEWAEEAYEALNDPIGIINSGNTKGSTLWKNGKYDEAEHHLKTVLETGLATLGEENEYVALTYNELGNTYYNQSKLDLSLEYLEKARQIRIALFGEQHSDVAESYNNLAVAHANSGNYQKSVLLLEKALMIRENIFGTNHPSTAPMHQNIGTLYRLLGNYEKSEFFLLNSIKIDTLALGEEHPYVAKEYENLAVLFYTLGLFDKSINLHKDALAIRQATLDSSHADIARSYHNIGATLNAQGKHLEAIEYLQLALRLRKSILGDHHEAVASTLNIIGTAYRATSQLQLAKDAYTESIQLKWQVYQKEHPEIANSLFNLGKTYQLNDNFELANDAYLEALDIQHNTLGPNHPSLAATHHSIGDLYLSMNNLSIAKRHFNKALSLQRKTYGDTHPDLANTYASLGIVALEEQSYQRAIFFFNTGLAANLASTASLPDTSLPNLENALSSQSLFTLLRAKSNAFYQQYLSTQKLDYLLESQQHYQYLTDLQAQHRRSFRSQASKLAFNEKSVDIIEEALVVNLALYRLTQNDAYIESAFSIMEKGKATALLDAQIEADARQFSGIPDSLLIYEKDLRARLAFYDENLKKEEAKKEKADSAKVDLWRDKTFTMRQKYDVLLDSFESNYPNYYNLKYENQAVSVNDIRDQILTSDDVLIEYFTGKDSLYTFVVTDDQISVSSLHHNSTLNTQIEQLRRGIILREDSLYLSNATTLYEHLIKPVFEIAATKNNWIIIPDGMLNYIPFESLLTTPVPEFISYGLLPYLIKQHSIQYAYSSTLEAAQRQTNKHDSSLKTGTKDFIAFAPVFPDGINKNTRAEKLMTDPAFNHTFPFHQPNTANDRTGTKPQNYALSKNLANLSREDWGHLPQTKVEIKAIASLFQQQYGLWDRWFSGRSSIYLEKAAKESVVKSNVLGEHRFVHFATHGLINEAIPELSGIVLAQDTTHGEDGVLHLGEVYNLTLDAELVVLSACDTGLGKLAQGEGLIGLSRGFMYAGAQSLLVSLWKVQDGSTRYMMEFFYENLLSNQTKTEATRNAKLSMIDFHPVYAMPYYWAGFVLIGGDNPIDSEVTI